METTPGTTSGTTRRGVELRFGLRAVLLIVAIFMFVLAVILDANAFDVAMIGLACLSGSMLVNEFGLDGRPPGD
ncbi:MAG TPA: hypothetical protein VHC63_14420 [Acidimicrobiales bacterium]|nr:hypothetical protein [Acidimicrobiales bacterium]